MSAVSVPLLLITANRQLISEVLAVAGPLRLPVEVTACLPIASECFLDAPVVLIGADLLDAFAASNPVARPQLIVVGLGDDGQLLWRAAEVLPAAAVTWLPASARWLTNHLMAVVCGARDADAIPEDAA